MASLKLFLLGPPRLELGGQIVTVDTRKAVAMLAYLVMAGERLTRDSLAALLWPEFDDSRAKAALRRTLSALRGVIGREHLYTTREHIGLESDAFWCDLNEFRNTIESVNSHGHRPDPLCQKCITTVEQAVALYRDDFLAGFSLRDSLPFDEWQRQQAEYWRGQLALLLEQLVQTRLAQGNVVETIPIARTWLRIDPLREEVHRQLIQLYAWSGQRSAALKQYQDCVRILDEELGVSPLMETTALYQMVQEDRLPLPKTVAALEPPPLALPTAEIRITSIPFVGRGGELQQLADLYQQVGPDGRFLAIAGEVGIGKTRLATTFLAGLPGVSQLRARCYAGESQLAYAPFAQALRTGLQQSDARERLGQLSPAWLAEAMRLLPEVADFFPDLPPPPPLDWAGAASRFTEGLGRVLEALLAGEQPGILWLDDVQWLDSSSLELLGFLVRRWRERPYLILVCWRSGDLTTDSTVLQLMAQARREGGGGVITLERLQAASIAQIVASVAGHSDSERQNDIAKRLFRETEGLPFLVDAYLHSLPDGSEEQNWNWSMPRSVHDLFQSRLFSIQETEKQILQAGAVIGRSFSYDLVKRVSGRDEEETILALEQTIIQQLLLEQPGSAVFDFTHNKLRDLVLEQMSLVRQQILHKRAAQTLVNQYVPNEILTSERAARIANHFQQGGMTEQAADYYFEAGQQARSIFAHREAMVHFQTALAMGHKEVARLHEFCGDSAARLGEYDGALKSYEHSAALDAGSVKPALAQKMGQVYARLGEWGLAVYHFQQAEAVWLPAEAKPELAWLYVDWSYTTYRAGDMAKAHSLVEQARAQATSPAAQAQIQNILGILARQEGNLAAASQNFAHSYGLALEHGLLSLEITALNNMAQSETVLGNHQHAQELFNTALHQCQHYGDRHWEAALYSNLADLLHEMGEEEEAMAQLKKSIVIYAQIGQATGDWRPEVWKLSEW